MTRSELLLFLREHRLAVQASISPHGTPQSAVVGIGVSDALEIVFDTLESTRKHANLRRDPRISLVVGWDEKTAQIEGVADFPTGAELDRIRDVYFATYPDGRERLAWPGIQHVRVRPTWARLSDFTVDPPRIEELGGSELGGPELGGNTMPLPPTRVGFHTVIPRLVVADVAAEVAFLREVLDARGELHEGRPAELRIGDSLVMVSSSGTRQPAPGFLYVYVDDPDAAYDRAIARGATSLEEPRDTPYGDRRAMVRDPFGNVWQLACVGTGA